MKLDMLGVAPLVDDTVIFQPPRYKGLLTGKVLKVSPKGVTVEYQSLNGNWLERTFRNEFVVDLRKRETPSS